MNLQEKIKQRQNKRKKEMRYLLIILLILSIPQFVFRFKHPEMTETELYLNFFKAYYDFFMKLNSYIWSN